MSREDETMYYITGNGIRTLSCAVGVSGVGLCISLLHVRDYILWGAAVAVLLQSISLLLLARHRVADAKTPTAGKQKKQH